MKNILTLLCLWLTLPAMAQDIVLAKTFVPQMASAPAVHVISSFMNDSGQYYVAGNYEKGLRVDSAVLPSTTSPQWYECSSFICRYDAAGKLLQEVHSTGTGLMTVQQMTNDAAGNIYLLAYTQGQIQFCGITANTNIGIFSYLVIKLDNQFNLLWSKLLLNNFSSGHYDIRTVSLSCKSNGQPILVGYADGNYILDGLPITGNQSKPFMAQLNQSTGMAEWVTQLQGSNPLVADNLILKANNNQNLILEGQFGTQFGSSYLICGGTDTLFSVHDRQNFIAVYDSAGVYQWSKRIDTTYPGTILGMNIDANNQIFLSGTQHLKLDPMGNVVWVHTIDNGSVLLMTGNEKANYQLIGFLDSMQFAGQSFYADGYASILCKTDTASGQIIGHSKPYDLDYVNELRVNKRGICTLTGETYFSLLGKQTLYANDTIVGYMLSFNDSSINALSGNLITGKVFQDVNNNCVLDAEAGIADFTVMAMPGPVYTISDSLGNYRLWVDTGTYTVSTLTPVGHGMVTANPCGISSYTSVLSTTGIIDSAKHFPKDYHSCYLLKAYISRDILTDSCIPYGKTMLAIRNFGLDTAYNVGVQVQYPSNAISPLNSLPAWTSYSASTSTVTYQISVLSPQSIWTAEINDTIDCALIFTFMNYPFSMTVTPLNSCYLDDTINNSASYNATVILPVQVNNSQKPPSKFRVFPNPAEAEIYISNSGEAWPKGSITLQNMAGQTLIHSTFNRFESGEEKEIRVEALHPGVYILRITAEGKAAQMIRFIKK